jgi:hypothetical protein
MDSKQSVALKSLSRILYARAPRTSSPHRWQYLWNPCPLIVQFQLIQMPASIEIKKILFRIRTMLFSVPCKGNVRDATNLFSF